MRALDPHPWHMSVSARLAEADADTFRATRTIAVVLGDDALREGCDRLVDGDDVGRRRGDGRQARRRGRADEARYGAARVSSAAGPEYLRIIYGPDYTSPEQLVQLRQRNVNHKRSLAIREFSLGIEALERFVREEPLHRVHECVFGVLALESEPVDPRL